MKGIKQIKNYRLTREIGKGAAGTVFEAIDEKTNKLVAVKSIQSSKLKNKRVMENFKRELKLLHGLNHSNIVKIAGVEKTVNNIYLILEYCNGGNLYEYLHFYKKFHGGAPLPEVNVQVILRQLIDGLEYMHNCRTIHRDIKLENILVNFNAVANSVKQGENVFKIDYELMDLLDITVKIADLGYARELEGAGVASTMCGTPITMAPDIVGLFNTNSINKDNKYNNKVDLWSLGAITYELIVGSPVFSSTAIKELFEEIMNGRYMMPQLKISLQAISFINGLLQFYPDKRMNWNQIRNHEFIVNDIKTFHYIDLTTVENSNEKVMVDTKDCENLLWVLYQTNFSDNIHIDKIDKEVFKTKANETLTVRKNSKDENSEDEKKKEVELVIDHKPIEKLDSFARNDEVLLKENCELKRNESEEYEEANNEICICDEEIDMVQEKEEQSEMKKMDMERNSKENKIFGKLLMEMEQDLKNSKHNSKVINLEESVKEIVKEFDVEAETYIVNKCETEDLSNPADHVVEIKQEQIEDNKNNSYDDCAVNTNEENIIKDESGDKQPEDNELAIPNENFLEKVKDTGFSEAEWQHTDPKQTDAFNRVLSMDIPRMEHKDSPAPERESNLIQIESISEEGISVDYKANLIITVQRSLSNEYLEVNTEAEAKSASMQATEDEDDIWELISTTSITDEDISVRVEYSFDLIQEYF